MPGHNIDQEKLAKSRGSGGGGGRGCQFLVVCCRRYLGDTGTHRFDVFRDEIHLLLRRERLQHDCSTPHLLARTQNLASSNQAVAGAVNVIFFRSRFSS